MPKSKIHIVSFAILEQSFVEKIRQMVASEFQLSVKVKEGFLDISSHFDPPRRQYNANEILKVVDDGYSHDHKKVIGLFNIDLFIPILTFIFGQAYLGGKTGIASTYRLNPTRYGMPEDQNLLLQRTAKELIHELGHTFGLIHCHTPGCVMNSSTYVEDIDQKKTRFCQDCSRILHQKDSR